MNAIAKLLIYMIAIGVTAYLLPGIRVDSLWTILVLAVVMVILRAIVRPILLFLTLPFTILTLGLFVFVVNGIIVLIADALVAGFSVENLGWAILFSLVLSFISSLLEYGGEDPKSARRGSRKVGNIGA